MKINYKKYRSTYIRVYLCNIQLENVDKMTSNDSPSSHKNMGPEIEKQSRSK